MSIVAFRIARETREFRAGDLGGNGAALDGARWNDREIPMVYASLSRALAALETVVHLDDPATHPLPLDRYLVEITVPQAAWERRENFNPAANPGWDAIPASATALTWGSQWARERRTLVAIVPSVIVPEEGNVLLNPLHPDAAGLRATVVRKWLYGPLLGRI